MKINGLILGKGKPVTDGRTLNAMERAGHFTRKDRIHPYVDNEGKPSHFNHRGISYSIQYFSGCFYPFVVVDEVNS